MSRRLATTALWAGLLAGTPPLLLSQPAEKFVRQGIAVELSLQRADGQPGPVREGDSARVSLAFSDAATGTPMAGVKPGAWLDFLGSGPDAGAACRQKAESFLGGSLFARPELDLNVFYVLSLNQDATISVVDPLFGYGGSKLLAMVFLESPGEDWALAPSGNRLFVSLPDAGRVAVIESADWKVALGIDTPPRPRRLGLQPDGQYLWVAWDGADPQLPSGVSVIDVRSLRPVARLETGRGGHDLAFSDDSRFAFVTNEADGTVSVIDVARLAKVHDVPVGSRPTSIAWSPLAKAAYAVATGAGRIAVIDPGRSEPRAFIPAEPGIGRIRFAPGGRLAFVVHPEKNTVHIVDATSDRLIQTADVEAAPDQVTFSDELAYVRHRGSEIVLMIPLATVGEAGKPVPVVDFPGGQHPPGRLLRPTPADGIVQAPGATAVLVANPEDQVIYYYKEGMAAPMGHFQNYGKQPRAVLVVDRSLRETRPGIYETLTRLGPPGDYELVLFLDAPRLIHCVPVKVAENAVLTVQRKKRPLGVELRVDRGKVAVGEEVRVRLRLTDPESGAAKAGLKDVRVLTFLAPGIWQKRHWAADLGDGLYEIRFTPPEAGLYYVFVEVASQGLPLQKSPPLVLTAEARDSAR